MGGVKSHWAQKSQFINLTICRRSFISEWSSAAKTKTNVGGGIKYKISQLSTVCASRRKRDGESWKIWKSCHYNRIKDIGRDCTNEKKIVKMWNVRLWNLFHFRLSQSVPTLLLLLLMPYCCFPRFYCSSQKSSAISASYFSFFPLWFMMLLLIYFHYFSSDTSEKRVSPSTWLRVLGSTMHINGEKRAELQANRRDFMGFF